MESDSVKARNCKTLEFFFELVKCDEQRSKLMRNVARIAGPARAPSPSALPAPRHTRHPCVCANVQRQRVCANVSGQPRRARIVDAGPHPSLSGHLPDHARPRAAGHAPVLHAAAAPHASCTRPPPGGRPLVSRVSQQRPPGSGAPGAKPGDGHTWTCLALRRPRRPRRLCLLKSADCFSGHWTRGAGARRRTLRAR